MTNDGVEKVTNPKHDRPIDRFYGGPLDGHEQAMNPAVSVHEERVDAESGSVYKRTPTLDTEETAGWTYLHPEAENRPGTLHTINVRAASKETPVSLRQVRELVEYADRLGFPEDTPMRALVFFKGTVKTLELRGE